MAQNFGLGALLDAGGAVEGGERERSTSVFVHRVDSLVVSYRDDRQEEQMCTRDRLPPPWRLNLVAASQKFQFIAARDVILVQRITLEGLEPHAALRLQVLAGTTSEPAESGDDGEDEQFINAIRVGELASRTVLVSVDTAAAVNVWDAHTLEFLAVFRVSQSAWSIAFDRSLDCILIGSNAWDITTYSLSEQLILDQSVEHAHNIPALDCDGHVRVSASIDGTCHIRNADGEDKVQIVDIGSWCWTCKIIRISDVEPCSIFGQERGLNTRVAYLHRADAAGETLPLMDSLAGYEHAGELGYGESDVDYGDFPFDEEDDELEEEDDELEEEDDELEEEDSDLEKEDEVEARPLVLEDHWEPMDEEEWSGNEETRLSEADTESLNRQRRQLDRPLSPNVRSENSDNPCRAGQRRRALLGHPEQIGQALHLFLSGEEEVHTDETVDKDFIALTTAHDLYLVRLQDGRILLKHELPQLMSTSVHGQTLFGAQFNRFCMMHWVGRLSCLFLGNQAGYLIVYHFQREAEANRLAMRSILIDPTSTAPMAGFSVFEQPVDRHPATSRQLWYLYALYLDGHKLLVQIERRFNQELDLTRLHLS